MYTYNDLVAALQSGVSVEDIAAQMTKDLNAAKAEVDRRAAEKAAAEAEAKRIAHRRQLVSSIFGAMTMYVTEIHPNSLLADYLADMNASDADLDEFAEQLDALVGVFASLRDLSVLLDTPHVTAHKVPETIGKVSTKSTSSDALEDFLNQFVRK